jgi:hypothetical protein
MAKAKRGTKSAAIREYLAANPGTRTKDVIAALKQKGIRVSGPMVSTLKGKLGGSVKKRAAAGHNQSPSIEDLIEAKKLADRLGGVDKASAAVAVLAKLL